jgi:hypothetical protein
MMGVPVMVADHEGKMNRERRERRNAKGAKEGTRKARKKKSASGERF